MKQFIKRKILSFIYGEPTKGKHISTIGFNRLDPFKQIRIGHTVTPISTIDGFNNWYQYIVRTSEQIKTDK